MNFEKLLSLTLSLLVFIGCTACKGGEKAETPSEDNGKSESTAYGDNMEKVFDDANIVLTAPMLSDIHLEGGWSYESSYERFLKAIEVTVNNSVTKKADLVCVAGDLVCCTNSKNNVYHSGKDRYTGTYEEEYAKQSKLEKENLLRAIVDSVYPDSKFFYCLGNHDGEKYAADFIKALSGTNNEYYDYFYGNDLDKEALLNGNRHITVNGYNFLALTDSADDEDYLWLKNKLDAIIAKEPNKTVFLLHHFKPANMTYASTGHNKDIRDFLKDYPQVIVFGGHSHSYVDLENAIMQSEEGYISVDCGALQDNAWEYLINQSNKAVGINYSKDELGKRYTGLLMEVDGKGNIRISRFDFSKNARVGNNWIIPAPKSDGTRELTYTKSRGEAAEKPVFSSTDFEVEYSSGYISLKVPKAYSAEKVLRYEITITNSAGEKLATEYMSSLFFRYPNYSNIPEFYNAKFKPSKSLSSGTYTVSVVAVDCWANKSKAIKATITV